MSNFEFPGHLQRVLITGGAGFIGGAVVRRLLATTNAVVYNLDKMGYASDLQSVEETIAALGESGTGRHHLLKVDLTDGSAVDEAVRMADPDLVMHLAAESHVDRSIDGPESFIASNVVGTFNLLQSVRSHWDSLQTERKEAFRFHHISTDEVFGSLGAEGRFSETTPYDPRSPYSASKASSDHLVRAWHHTYGLPVVLTNCSNNYGPWQFPEKLIPVVTIKALNNEEIPLYGDGQNIRDWLFVEDHVSALLLAATKGVVGKCYCVGGHGERTNKQVVLEICRILDSLKPSNQDHASLIASVKDRPGHDRRYAIDPSLIEHELGWKPEFAFEQGLRKTVEWYVANQEWCQRVCDNSSFQIQRLGSAR